MLPINLVGPNGRMTPPIYGLVDTGADLTLMPYEMAEVLGFDIDDCTKAVGQTAGGESEEWHHPEPAHILLMGRKLPIYTRFSKHMEIVLLGRADFLSHMTLTVVQREQKFSIEFPEDDLSPEAIILK